MTKSAVLMVYACVGGGLSGVGVPSHLPARYYRDAECA